jgi:hypothetical protein
MASADVVTAKAKATLINNVIIVSSYKRPEGARNPKLAEGLTAGYAP